MIHPTDLRLGNLVTTIHGERIEIKYLSKKKVKDGYYVTAGVSAEKCFLPEHLSGILPTEEWLLGLGMIQSVMKTWWYKFEEQFEIEFYEDEFWLNGYDGTMQPIKHIHQLQNLYHALTGEELTIKESATEP